MTEDAPENLPAVTAVEKYAGGRAPKVQGGYNVRLNEGFNYQAALMLYLQQARMILAHAAPEVFTDKEDPHGSRAHLLATICEQSMSSIFDMRLHQQSGIDTGGATVFTKADASFESALAKKEIDLPSAKLQQLGAQLKSYVGEKAPLLRGRADYIRRGEEAVDRALPEIGALATRIVGLAGRGIFITSKENAR